MNQSLRDRDIVLTLLKSNLANAQCRMKVQADKHRSKRVLNVGDWVYLRLVPYQHFSLAFHPFHKLQPGFYGPFQVMSKVEPVACKLQLLEHYKLHHVFHVSCLKKQLRATVQATANLPIITYSGILQDASVTILDLRMIKKNNIVVIEVLIQWQNHSREDAT